jgi:hypothetical protein
VRPHSHKLLRCGSFLVLQSVGSAVFQLDQQFNGGEADVWGAEGSLHQELGLPGKWLLIGDLAGTWTESAFRTGFVSALPRWGTVEPGDALPYLPQLQGTAGLSAVHPRVNAALSATGRLWQFDGRAWQQRGAGLDPRAPLASGHGRVAGREVAAVSNDFTVKGASSAQINIKKLKQMKAVAKKRGIPLVFLGESTGARMPDVMGAGSIGSKDDPYEYQRMREVPWAAGVLGHCYGSSAWYGSMSDFCVMRKGAIIMMSSKAR